MRRPSTGLAIVCIAAICAVTPLAGCGSSSGGQSPSGSRPAAWGPLPVNIGDAAPGTHASGQVTFTPNTVVVTPSEVASSLSGVSADGSTYTFSSDSGPLGDLAPGKVMLLESLDAAKVTSVSHSGSSLVVDTEPIALSDLISQGNISVSGPPDLAGAFASEVATGPVTGGSETLPQGATPVPTPSGSASPSPSSTASPRASPTSSPSPSSSASSSASASASPSATGTSTSNHVGALSELGPMQLDGFSGRGYTYSNTSGDLAYAITLTAGADGVHASGGFCFSSSGSPSVTGTCSGDETLKGDLNGLLTYQTQSAQMAITKGQAPRGALSLAGLSAQLKVTYVALRGNGSQIAAKLKPFRIPFSFEMPVCPPPTFCAGVPLYMKVQLAVLVTLGISAKQSSMQGGFNAVVAGSGGVVDETGFTVIAGSQNGFHLSGQFIPGTSITPGASGAEVGLQLKVSLGIGIRGFNAMFFISFVAAIGQVTGSLVAAEYCQNYYANFSITGGLEAQFWIFKVSSPSVTLFYKNVNSTPQPPC